MKLEATSIANHGGSYTRKVWRRLLEADPPGPVGIFLDAEIYLEHMNTVQLLEELEDSGRLPATSWIFVSSPDAEARHRDFTCCDAYARFIAESVRPSWSNGNVLICGLSLSGLASAHIALSYPQHFAGALCQSGSFWWDNERFAAMAEAHCRQCGRFWLSVGDKETDSGIAHPPTGLRQEVSQLDAVGRAAAALQDAGCKVMHRVHEGAHDSLMWREELPAALDWLLDDGG